MKINKKIGLALGSGGPRGLAHIGVIKALKENDIPIDIIAGSSAGALIGGLFASLGSIKKVEEIAKQLTYKDLVSVFSEMGASSGIFKGDKIESYLNNILKNKNIESLNIPFVAVATDINTGESVNISSGNLAKAIRASSSIPTLVSATNLNGKYLVDGGASNPVPVHIAKTLGADITIAVNLDVYNYIDTSFPLKRIGVRDMGVAALKMLRSNLSNELCKEADITITPDVANVSSINIVRFVHGDSIIEAGYEAAKNSIPKIKKILKNM